MILTPEEFREKMHSIPEVAFNEYKTTQFIVDNIRKVKDKYDSNIELFRVLETGLICVYTKDKNKGYTLFRADIDALPIKEETGVSYKSKNSNMHACGHDVHSAILYGTILETIKNNIDKNFIFVFQPAEEHGGGAEKILETGFLDKYKINNAFALHVTDEYDIGTVSSTKGTLFASAMEFDIDFKGEAAHCARPDKGKDALNAARVFLDEIEKMPKNPEIPLVIGIGKMQAGNVRNIVAPTAKIEGTLRSIDSKSCEKYREDMKNILKGIEVITGVETSFKMGSFYKEVTVDAELFDRIENILKDQYTITDVGFKFTGEDFGFFTKKYPSYMFWLGTNEGKQYGLHNPKFLPSSKVIDIGIDIYKRIINNI
ncbi:MAG: amidohydrolase [Thermotogota bacterium]